MTTTHTFQGLNADGKPSSRVSNPPGGSSHNIFGGSDEPQQKVPIRNNPDNINRSNNDVFGPGHNAASIPQQKSRAPRSGDDSFHTLFGNCRTSGGSDKASNSSRRSSPVSDVQRVDCPQRTYSRMHQRSPDTFVSIFGREVVEHRQMFRRVLNNNDDDSFGRLFGPSCTSGSTPSNPSSSVSTVRSSAVSSISPSRSKISQNVSRADITENKDATSPSFSAVFGTNLALDKRRTRQGRFSDRGAFNPITGEAYEQQKQEAPAPVYSAPSKSNAVSSHKHETCEAPISVTVVDQETPQPAIDDNPQTSTMPEAAQAADHKKQQQSGVFGGEEDVKELRSTRVSQPPGGRSTKLW